MTSEDKTKENKAEFLFFNYKKKQRKIKAKGYSKKQFKNNKSDSFSGARENNTVQRMKDQSFKSKRRQKQANYFDINRTLIGQIPNQDDSTFYLKYTNMVTPDAALFQATVTPPNASLSSLTTISNLWFTKQHLSSKTLHISSTSLTNLDTYLVTLSLSH